MTRRRGDAATSLRMKLRLAGAVGIILNVPQLVLVRRSWAAGVSEGGSPCLRVSVSNDPGDPVSGLGWVLETDYHA